MPLFKVSVESEVPVSAVVQSTATTEADALAEVRLLQARARINWRRGLAAIGAIEAPYEIWAQGSPNAWVVSLYAVIPISSLASLVAEDSKQVAETVASRQSSGLVKWTYRGIPVGDYREPIPTFWSNQLPDEPTVTTISLSTYATFPGQSVTLSADVSGEETPVGNLEFRDSLTNTVIVPTTLEADPVTAGLAHAQAVVVLPVGGYQIEAVYLGSDGYQPSSSDPVFFAVNQVGTTILITPPSPPIYAGQSVSLNALIIQGIPAAAKPTGTITLFEGTTVIASTLLDANASGNFSLGALPPGTYAFTIQYSGDSIHNGCSGSVSGIQVLQAPTVSNISVVQPNGAPFPPELPEFSQTVRLSATVTSVVPGTVPVGTVTFKEGVTVLGTGVLAPAPSLGNNVATAFFDKTDFTVATHSSLTAVYPGNASFAASVSGSASVVVNKAFTAVNAFSTNSPTVFGQSAVFDATVAVQSPGTITPFQKYGTGGSVTYKDSSVVVVNFDGTGHAGRTISNLSVGTNEVGVTFAATAEFNSGFNSFPHTVAKANTVTHITSFNPDPAAWYYSTTIVCTVAPVAPGAGTITGTVSFSVFDQNYFGNLFLGTGTMMGGTAGLTFNWFIVFSDNYTYTALYNGDAHFNTSQDTQDHYGYGYYF